MTVSDNTIKAEHLRDFFTNLAKKGLNISKEMAKKFLKTLDEPWILQQTLLQRQLLEILKNVMPKLSELITICNTGKRLHIGNFVPKVYAL